MNEFEEQDYQAEKISFGVWKKIIGLVVKRKKAFVLLIVFVSCLAILDVVYPFFNSYALENFFENDTGQSATPFIICYSLIAVCYGITVFGFIKYAGKVEVEVGYQLRKEAFNQLQKLPFSYYDKTAAGWIMARLTSDSRRLADIISWGLVDMLWGGLSMIGILIVLLIIKPILALIIIVLLPLLLVVSIYFRKKILKSYRGVRKTNSKITAAYNEGILGNKTTKTLVLEEYNDDEFDKKCRSMRKDSIRAILLSSIFFPTVLVLSYVAFGATYVAGGALIMEGLLTIPVLYLFLSYTTQFFDPVMQIARILAEFQQAQASAERIMSLIETEPDIYDSEEVIEKYGTLLEPKRENWEKLEGDVEFKHVSFKYEKGEPVLDDFNLNIKKGTSVALVGETGAGKTTIVNLICRFYEPTSGTILIDGKDYKSRSLGWLHENLGYVLQSPHLFNGSIADNIRYGRLDATLEEVKEAAKAVSADEFIEKFDNGYDTLVGEGGSKLSVGQRQLISFARALLADPRILILDEATSSIDTKTEVLVQDVINKLLKGRTSFIVAHRLSTIINADKIIVIKNGKIIEEGTHRELLDKEGEYYSLYRNQFINEEMEKTKF